MKVRYQYGSDYVALQATDITLARSGPDGTFVALLGLRQPTPINSHVVPALKSLLLSVDSAAVVDKGTSQSTLAMMTSSSG